MQFPEVPERDANGVIALVYADIRRALHVPMVNLIYRHMAAFPECPPWAWGILREHFGSTTMADGIQSVLRSAEALQSPWGPCLACASDRESDNVREVAQYYNAGNAVNLIALLALRIAMERGVAQAHGSVEDIVISETAPTAPAPRPIARIDTRPILDGHIKDPELALELSTGSADPNSRKMLAYELDAAEMSIATCVQAFSQRRPFVGVPVFMSRRFLQSCVVLAPSSTIHEPPQLQGARIAIPQYWATSSIWHRLLQTDVYGVAIEDVACLWGSRKSKRDRSVPQGSH